MTDQMDEPFAEKHWRHDLALALWEHELDQISGINSEMLAEYMSAVAESLVKLIKKRDQEMPGALGATERAELAALRKAFSLQEVVLARTESLLDEAERAVVNLEILLKDAYAQRDRALAERGVAPE